MKTKIYQRQKLLNTSPSFGTGHIYWRVKLDPATDSRDKKKLKSVYLAGKIEIADCFRKITIDLQSGNKTSYDNSIAKLDILIEELKKAKSSLEKSYKEADKLLEKHGLKSMSKRKCYAGEDFI